MVKLDGERLATGLIDQAAWAVSTSGWPAGLIRAPTLEFVSMSKTLKPGHATPTFGEIGIVGPRGGQTGQERSAMQSRPLPPTPKPGQRYVVDRPAHDGGGKPK